MTPECRTAVAYLRESAERARRLADELDARGELQKAWDCRALADLEEERARQLERRLSRE